MNFEFATATRIIFGAGKLGEAGKLVAGFGSRALILTGSDPTHFQQLAPILSENGVTAVQMRVNGEPSTRLVQEGVALARRHACDVVVGLGGGSAMDAGKAIAALLTNEGDLYDYLEVVGKGKNLVHPSAPYVAIPTTAGTGTEVTRNAVLSVPEYKVKVSLRSQYMLARLAIVDPALTYSMPPLVTASTGLDALTQLIEPFVCNQPNPVVDAICRAGLGLVVRSLMRAYRDGGNLSAREDMSLAALFSGMSMANARLGGVHGFAGVLGGTLEAPHGILCARLLPFVMSMNIRALSQRDPRNEVLQRYDEVARILTGDFHAKAEDGESWINAMCADLQVPPLSRYGLKREQFPEIIEKSMKASSMKGNPVTLTREELAEILELAL